MLFWIFALGQTERSVFGRVPILDEVYYLDRAAELAGAETPLAEPYFMSPLYPRLVAAAGAGGGVPEDRVFAGAELRGLRLLQIFCWLGTLILIRLLAARLVPDDWTGRARAAALWLPVILFALYRPAAVYALAVLLETPLLFLVIFSVYLMSARGSKPAWVLLLGVSLGLAGLLRGTTLLLVPVAMAFLWRGVNFRSALSLGVLVVGVALALAPAVVHNSRLVGHPVGPTLNGGVNLYIGNGPEANGFYVAAVPGDWRHDPAGRQFLAERFDLPQVSLAQADSIWAESARHHMRRDPGRVLGLMARKIWLQLQTWEIDQLTPLAGWTAQVPTLRLLVTPYALMVVLGLAGLVGNRKAWWLAAALVLLLLGQSLFFVVSRYRLVLIPMWSVLAGVGAIHLYRRQRLALVVAALALLVTVPWGLNDVRTSWAALAQANEALRWADVGQAEDSRPALEKAELLYRQS
ncbi:MAG: phospholipid carrier-dependent glycosyltransferase, partial [Candidatus Krumholzibacteria bacterium]|nr:phospholipid carrier-dependent glycosyltransferase [Candidatus Krumholzibacteria bacterium]